MMRSLQPYVTIPLVAAVLTICTRLESVCGKQTINYKYINSQPLQIDVFDYSGRSDPKAKSATLIYIHGGGWEFFSKNDIPDYVNGTAQAGKFVLVSVQYRLTDEAEKWGGYDAVTWPSQGEDCLDAVKYVYEHAEELGVDRERMVCWGGSAGGHLCAYTALAGSERGAPTRLKAAVSYYPPTNILMLYSDIDPKVGIDRHVLQADSFESLLLGSAKSHISLGQILENLNNTDAPWPELLQRTLSVDPEFYISEKSPTMLIAHGTMDHTVPYKQGVRLSDALTHFNQTTHVFLTAEGCDHAALPRSCWETTIELTSEWLYQQMK